MWCGVLILILLATFSLLQVQARYFGLDGLADSFELRVHDTTGSRVGINAGGQLFETSRATILKQPQSRIGRKQTHSPLPPACYIFDTTTSLATYIFIKNYLCIDFII